MQLPLGGIERIAAVSQEWAHHQTLRQLTAALPATQSRFPLLSLNIIFISVRLLFSHFYPGRLFNIIIFIYKYYIAKTHTDASETTFHPATQLLDFLYYY